MIGIMIEYRFYDPSGPVDREFIIGNLVSHHDGWRIDIRYINTVTLRQSRYVYVYIQRT